jgi:site-specific DNA recombinase
MRLADLIDQDTFGAKATELRDRLASIKLQVESVDRTTQELAELALKVFDPKKTRPGRKH